MILLMLVLLDGSQLNMNVPAETVWEYKTPYGVMQVPIKKIHDIQFGIHLEDEKPFIEAVKNLSNETYNLRNSATKFLKDNQREAYKFILPLKESKDPEVAKRVEQLLDQYKSFPTIEDSLELVDSNFRVGFLSLKEIKGESKSLGKMTIKVSELKSLAVKSNYNQVTKLQPDAEWVDIGWSHGAFTIAAMGEVDLWPMTPGVYKCGPKGHTINTGPYPAGALLGRVNGGEVFVVGEHFTSNRLPRGKVEVRVNGSPWPNSGKLDGFFEVRVE